MFAPYASNGADPTACPLPTDAISIGKAGWPAVSACDVRHLGLVLAFLDEDTSPAVQRHVLTSMQHKIECGEHGLPEKPAAAACCALGAQVLRARGTPWLEEEWELAPEVLAVWRHERGDSGLSLLEMLLRIFTVNAHSFGRQAALFDVATKLAHTCHNADLQYIAHPDRGVGQFVALRDIQGEAVLLTTSYLSPKHFQVSTPQRRRMLYCQKGFVCLCPACSEQPDVYRRLANPLSPGEKVLLREAGADGRWQLLHKYGEMCPTGDSLSDEDISELLATEERLVQQSMHLYAGVDVTQPRRMPDHERTQLDSLLPECGRALGMDHFAYQILLRMTLTQQEEEVFLHGDDVRKEAWEQQRRECEAYFTSCETLHSKVFKFPSPIASATQLRACLLALGLSLLLVSWLRSSRQTN